MKNSNQDSNQNKSVAKVDFGFVSETLVPGEVTTILGMQPTRQYTKGDLSPRMKVPKPWGCWAVAVESNNVKIATRKLLDLFDGKQDFIAEVIRRFHATASVSIWWEPEGGQGGYTLPSDLLIELASLGERVDFTFISTNVEE
jgi:hypothetical protein